MTRLLVSLMNVVSDRRPAGDDEDERPEPAVAALIPLTREARRSIRYRPDVRIARFPFRIGRESRTAGSAAERPPVENRRGLVPPSNDLYLIEPTWSDLLYISRDHFAIERCGELFFVEDRGSVCGTVVGGKHIGGHRAGGRREVQHGDLIVVGTPSSPYVFRFEVAVPED